MSNRTGRDVLADLAADMDAWALAPWQRIHHLGRIAGHHKRLMDRHEPADRAGAAEHFGRWFAVGHAQIGAWKALNELYSPERASIHSEESA